MLAFILSLLFIEVYAFEAYAIKLYTLKPFEECSYVCGNKNIKNTFLIFCNMSLYFVRNNKFIFHLKGLF